MLGAREQDLLAVLVGRLSKIRPGFPETYTTYKAIHDQLQLTQQGGTFGLSLKRQGLEALARWTLEENKPAITGIVVSSETFKPGEGYFELFGKSNEDYDWWESEVRKSKVFDWAPFFPSASAPTAPDTPEAVDIECPDRVKTTLYRVLRDTAIARKVKVSHGYECQICGEAIKLADGRPYAEAHHIQPLGAPHNGPDVPENILCLCPNHHVEFDYGARELVLKSLRITDEHRIGESYIAYHNEKIFRRS